MMNSGNPSRDKSDDGPRLAIFQANWGLQYIHTNTVARELIRAGWNVDVFLYNADQALDTLDPGPDVEHLRVFVFEKNRGRGSAGRPDLRQRLRIAPQSAKDVLDFNLRRNDLDYLVPRHIVEWSRQQVAHAHYRCFIGVERGGLIWAGALAEQTPTPIIYYSTELFRASDYPFERTRDFYRTLRLEKRYHPKAQVTVIQDEARAQVLTESTGARNTEILLLPVSVCGPPITDKSFFLQDRLGIPREKKVILYFGKIHTQRYVPELIRAAATFPEDWVLVLHGQMSERTRRVLDGLMAGDNSGRVRLSTELVPADQIADLVASADVGLVFYQSDTVVGYLTGRSSEKAAWYARAGVPMIAFNYPSFMAVFDEYHCGRGIATIEEVTTAAGLIFDDHEAYRRGTFRAYDEVYEFTHHFAKVIAWLEPLRSI